MNKFMTFICFYEYIKIQQFQIIYLKSYERLKISQKIVFYLYE